MAKITIEKADGEYRVPAEDGYEDGAAYTDDKDDAIAIAKKIYGKDVEIKYRSVPEFVGGKYEKMRPKSIKEGTVMNVFDRTLAILTEGTCTKNEKKVASIEKKIEKAEEKLAKIDKKAKKEAYEKVKEEIKQLKIELKAASKACK
jgi:hypothetical protein